MPRPKNDDQALQTCKECVYLIYPQLVCEILGPITVESRHVCYRAGYAIHRSLNVRHGKVDHCPRSDGSSFEDLNWRKQ